MSTDRVDPGQVPEGMAEPRNEEDPREIELPAHALRRSYAGLRVASEEALCAMRESLLRHGQLTPVVVTRTSEGHEVVDGFKRVRSVTESGVLPKLRCRVLELSATEAKLAMMALNRPSSGLSTLEEAWVVRALHREDGLSQVEIAARMGRHKSWVCRRLELVERLGERAQEEVRLGRLCPTAARELVRLPRGNRQRGLMEATLRDGLSSREVAEVATLLRATGLSAARVKGILASPRGALASGRRRTKGTEEDPTLPPQVRKLLRKLGLVHNLSRSLTGTLARTELPRSPAARAALSPWWPRLKGSLERLCQMLPSSAEPSGPPLPPAASSRTPSSTSTSPAATPSDASPGN